MSKLKAMNTKRSLSLIGVFLLFFLLFNAPFTGLPSTTVGGYPALMVYFGICWITLTIVMFRFSRKQNSK